MKDEKQAALAAIQQINAVDGFDPSPLAVEYADLNTHEKRLRLPVMGQLAWFWLKHPEGPCRCHGDSSQGVLHSHSTDLCQLYQSIRSVFGGGHSVTRLFAGQGRRFPRGNGHRQQQSAGRCSTLALDSSSLRPATPLICQQWMN